MRLRHEQLWQPRKVHSDPASFVEQSKIKPVGRAVFSLPPKLLKVRYALAGHLGPKAHLPLRAVPLIFLCNFPNAQSFGSCSSPPAV